MEFELERTTLRRGVTDKSRRRPPRTRNTEISNAVLRHADKVEEELLLEEVTEQVGWLNFSQLLIKEACAALHIDEPPLLRQVAEKVVATKKKDYTKLTQYELAELSLMEKAVTEWLAKHKYEDEDDD